VNEFASRGRQSGKRVEQAAEISRRCGLPLPVVLELLQRRWRYVELKDEPPRWESPAADLVDGRIAMTGVADAAIAGIRPTRKAQGAVVSGSVYGMGGSVEAAVGARIAYTRRPGDDTAATWLAAEDQLNMAQYEEYQRRFAQWKQMAR
jgi:hypothetical protein